MTSEADIGGEDEPTRVAPATKPSEHPESVVITAEIPAFQPTRARRIGIPARPQPDDDSEARQPAHVALRATVWVLFTLFVLGLIGLAVEHFHPSWLAPLHNTVGTSTGSTVPKVGSSGRAAGNSTDPISGALTLETSTAKSATYAVPTSSSYSLLVNTSVACWTEVKVPPTSSKFAFAGTIAPHQSPKTIPVSGSSSIVLAASVTSLEVKVGGDRVGTIAKPKSLFTYTFVPTKS